MKFLVGKKMGMSQIFTDDGNVVPVTVIKVEPHTVVQVKTKDKDKYEAVQVGTGTTRKINKPAKGRFKDLGSFRYLREFRGAKTRRPGVRAEIEASEVGDKFDVSVFNSGDVVKVTGMSKGKGFQGVVKRHGFHGGWGSHGHHSVLRHAGSIGQRFPQHTLKGMRMAGRMGHDKVTTRGLKIIKVDAEKGFLAVKGAVPGNNGGIVIIQSQ